MSTVCVIFTQVIRAYSVKDILEIIYDYECLTCEWQSKQLPLIMKCFNIGPNSFNRCLLWTTTKLGLQLECKAFKDGSSTFCITIHNLLRASTLLGFPSRRLCFTRFARLRFTFYHATYSFYVRVFFLPRFSRLNRFSFCATSFDHDQQLMKYISPKGVVCLLDMKWSHTLHFDFLFALWTSWKACWKDGNSM